MDILIAIAAFVTHYADYIVIPCAFIAIAILTLLIAGAILWIGDCIDAEHNGQL